MNFSKESIRIRLSLIIGIFSVFSIIMISRAITIQVIGDDKLARLASRQFQSKVLLKPRRGLIVDRTLEPLAINLETSSLAGNPSKILKSRASQHLLSKFLEIKPEHLKKRLNSKKSFAWFERHLREDRVLRLRKMGLLQPSGEMPEGLWLVKEMKRVYPHGNLAQSLIGSVNIDTDGIEGIELWKNKILEGKSARFDAVKDALGRPALYANDAQTQIQDGENVELSLDASLQFSVESALQASMETTRARQGLVMVMDSRSGEILALAQSSPENEHSKVKKLIGLTDGYEPGSTLKPLMMAMAIEQGLIKPKDQLFGHYGKFTLSGRTISEAESHEKFGMISLHKMVEVSSNIAAAELALKMGPASTVQSLKKLGLGQRTGTGFPGEIAGWTPSNPKLLKPLTLATIGFGQSLLVTPIQMLRAYAALSNGGFLVEPTLLKRKQDEPFKSVQILHPIAVKETTEALIRVTEGERGTGSRARVPGFKVAGKTGTAQTVDPGSKRYSRDRYIASFIGYPANVSFPVTILTWLDHPKGSYYASTTAAPLFAEVLKQTANRFSIPATEKLTLELSQESTSSERPTEAIPADLPEEQKVVLERSSVEPLRVDLDHPVMPNLIGLTPQEAMKALAAFQPRIKIQGFGLIRSQSPVSGTELKTGAVVQLELHD